MIIPKEVQCRTCLQVFCCAKCRQKHEDGNHQEDAMLRKICYICNDRPFPLRKDTKITPNNLLIVHILKEHLPLECNRCRKVFYSLTDFQQINKCFTLCSSDAGKEGECYLESSGTIGHHALPTIDADNKENIAVEQPADDRAMPSRERRKSSLVPGDFQPFGEVDNKIDEVDEALLTPLTKINLRWKRKSRQSFESMLSMTNNSSEVNASGLLRVDGGPGPRKLVRTTSTPMYQWQLMPTGPKQPNESYSATMGQMSSIHCSSGSDTDSRAEDLGASPPVPNELDKVRAIIRNRSKAVATPLRQVMSKSIQRAIAQHTAGVGGVYSKMLQPGTQRKMSFNSTMSSGMNSMLASPTKDPLDLRTTPTLKRLGSGRGGGCGSATSAQSTQAQRMVRPGDPAQESVQLAQADAVPNANTTDGSEYYETHRDMESLQGSSALGVPRGEDSLRKLHSAESYPVTPKPGGGGTALKKVSSFQALQELQLKGEQQSNSAQNDTLEDVWGTPCGGGIPGRSYSCSAAPRLGDTFKAYDASVEDAENDSGTDDVFYPVKGRPNIRQGKSDRDAFADNTLHESKVGKLDGMNATRSGGGGGGGKLWSIVSNVIRLASRSDVTQEEHSMGAPRGTTSAAAGGGGILHRAASFADYLKNRYTTRSDGGISRTSSSGSDEYRIAHESNGKKRRRVASTYARPYAPALTNDGPCAAAKVQQHSPVAKRKRIQSRQPIHRLRHTSSESGGSGSASGPGRYN
ncbi:mitosis initiation protein fs(1)Ya-like [Anopheles merus]|uniref:mitosis initiation protein fs(1)Ya-like n=1 Tax=Anopheles merus TaxID=30066 RepID=UPI001BE43D0C|nr:mitosis initiation protein fs(1)Ya-like [Anopheles merus]